MVIPDEPGHPRGTAGIFDHLCPLPSMLPEKIEGITPAPRHPLANPIQQARGKPAQQYRCHPMPQPNLSLAFSNIVQERRSQKLRILMAPPLEAIEHPEAVSLIPRGKLLE